MKLTMTHYFAIGTAGAGASTICAEWLEHHWLAIFFAFVAGIFWNETRYWYNIPRS